MTPNKEQIRAWLKEHGHNREWLAEQLGGISKRAVDNWFSTSGIIPESKLNLITQLMNAAELRADASEIATRASRDAGLIRSVSVIFMADEYELIAEAARDAGKNIDEYILESALKECGNMAGVRATEQNATSQNAAG